MEKEPEVRICKNKDCQKVLPAGYKYDECEACRNKKSDSIKKIAGGIFSFICTAGLSFLGIKKFKK